MIKKIRKKIAIFLILTIVLNLKGFLLISETYSYNVDRVSFDVIENEEIKEEKNENIEKEIQENGKEEKEKINDEEDEEIVKNSENNEEELIEEIKEEKENNDEYTEKNEDEEKYKKESEEEQELEEVENNEKIEENKEESKEEERTENVESVKDVENIEKKEENKATDSEITEEETVKEEIETEEKIEENIATKSDIDKSKKENEYDDETKDDEIDENIATTSEIEEKIEEEIKVATVSEIEIATDSEIEKATSSEVKESIDEEETYKKLPVLEQINYQIATKAEIKDNIIFLNTNIDLKYPIYVKEDTKINLNSYTIKSPLDDYAVVIENTNFTLLDEEENNGYILAEKADGAIYAKDSILNLLGGVILGIDKSGNGIKLVDTDIVIDGAMIYGGKGYEDESGYIKDGGNAIYIIDDKLDNLFHFKSGIVKGGQGGTGYNEYSFAEGGASFTNGYFSLEYEKTKQGAQGDKYQGNGGAAVFYEVEEEIESFGKIIIEDFGVSGGKGGKKNKTLMRRLFTLYGSDTLPNKFDLRDEDGNNYVTSVKQQESSGLCNTFSAISSAETHLLKYYSSYVEEILEKEGKTELNLSEKHLAYFLRNHPTDPLGNAGLSYDKFEGITENGVKNNYMDTGSNADIMSFYLSTWGGVATTNEATKWTRYDKASHDYENITSISDEYGLQNVAHLKESKIIDYEKYFSYDKNTKIITEDKEGFINAVKEAIYNNAGGIISMNIGPKDFIGFKVPDDSTVDYNGYKTRRFWNEDGTGGGHAMFVIGWDDTYSRENFKRYDSEKKEYYTPDRDGAFIIKQSTYDFDRDDSKNKKYNEEGEPLGLYNLISYGSSFYNTGTNQTSVNFTTYNWMPAYEEYENLYYYDGGSCLLSASNTVKSGGKDYNINRNYVVYKVLTNKERIKAVSYVSMSEFEGYAMLTGVNYVNGNPRIDTNNIYYKTDVKFNIGLNHIDILSDVVLQKDEEYAVVIGVEEGALPRVWIDRDIGDTEDEFAMSDSLGIIYRSKSVASGKSFRMGYAVEDNTKEVVAKGQSTGGVYNYRIKALTDTYYNLDFDLQGGEPREGDEELIKTRLLLYGDTIGELATPIKQGMKFVKWNTKADGTGEDIVATDTYNKRNYRGIINEGTTLYAQYANFSITFNANGGEMPTGQKIVSAANDNKTLKDCNVDYKNSSLEERAEIVGWFTKDDSGNRKDYYSLDTKISSFSEDTVLYADWKTYIIVTINANGGVMPTGQKTIKWYVGTNYLLEKVDYTRNHYILTGYYGLDGTEYDFGRDILSFNKTRDFTIYANWTLKEYTLTFNENNGVISGAKTLKYTIESIITLDDISSRTTKEHYELEGWTFNGATYNIDTEAKTFANFGDVTLRAKWTPITYTLTFNSNGGNIEGNTEIKYNIESVTMTLQDISNRTTNEGWFLNGWIYNGTIYAKNQNVTTFLGLGNITLIAKWVAEEYTLTFDSNGGSIEGEKTLIYSNESEGTIEEISNKTTRKYYYLEGWEYNGNTYSINQSLLTFLPLKSITLKAKWAPRNYTLTFDSNGGSISGSNTMDYDINSKDTIEEISNRTTRSNNKLVGWLYETREGEEDKIYSFTTKELVTNFKDFGTVTLMAIWKQYHTITFINEAASPSETNQYMYYETENKTLSAIEEAKFTRSGYKISKYEVKNNEEDDSEEKEYISTSQNINTFTGDKTLLVVWEKVTTNTTTNTTSTSSSRRRSSSGGGGGGGGGTLAPTSQAMTNALTDLQTTEHYSSLTSNYEIKDINNSVSMWQKEETTGKMRLLFTDGVNPLIPAANTFVKYVSYDPGFFLPLGTYYCFDEYGYLVTGFVETVDKKVYYFDDNENTLGQMVLGWKKMSDGKWFYFGDGGVMAKNTVTPDGYYVDENGQWIDYNASANSLTSVSQNTLATSTLLSTDNNVINNQSTIDSSDILTYGPAALIATEVSENKTNETEDLELLKYGPALMSIKQ